MCGHTDLMPDDGPLTPRRPASVSYSRSSISSRPFPLSIGGAARVAFDGRRSMDIRRLPAGRRGWIHPSHTQIRRGPTPVPRWRSPIRAIPSATVAHGQRDPSPAAGFVRPGPVRSCGRQAGLPPPGTPSRHTPSKLAAPSHPPQPQPPTTLQAMDRGIPGQIPSPHFPGGEGSRAASPAPTFSPTMLRLQCTCWARAETSPPRSAVHLTMRCGSQATLDLGFRCARNFHAARCPLCTRGGAPTLPPPEPFISTVSAAVES